jgi:hypothetical protein
MNSDSSLMMCGAKSELNIKLPQSGLSDRHQNTSANATRVTGAQLDLPDHPESPVKMEPLVLPEKMVLLVVTEPTHQSPSIQPEVADCAHKAHEDHLDHLVPLAPTERKVFLVDPVAMVCLEILDPLDHPAHQAQMANPVNPAHKVPLVNPEVEDKKAHLVHPVPMAHLDHLAHLVPMANLETKVHLVHPVHLVNPVQMVNPETLDNLAHKVLLVHLARMPNTAHAQDDRQRNPRRPRHKQTEKTRNNRFRRTTNSNWTHIFFLLLAISAYNSNIYITLGLCQQKCHKSFWCMCFVC